MVRLLRSFGLAAIACSASLCLASAYAADAPWKPTGKETPGSLKSRTSAMNRPEVVGKYYEAIVPDTLDLAERARLGINHLTSIISEEREYEMFYGGLFYQYSQPYLMFLANSLMACQCKCTEALAMLRLVSGSQQNLEREARMLEMMASRIGEDGIYWVYPSTDRPWLGPVENGPYAHSHGQARMMGAIIAWYQYTGNPRWKELVDRMVDGLDRHYVVHKDDYAYVPVHGWDAKEYFRSCYYRNRGWKDTTEPENEKSGEEGSLFVTQGHWPGVLANWYALTGNKQALRLAGEMVRFLTKAKFWADWKGGEYPGVAGAEHAHWDGHFHGYVNALRSILEYATVMNDARLKQFVRDGYEWTRQVSIPRIGFVGDSQSCGCARMIGLAIKLTDAGVGDYWEDVDLYIRNQGTEMQWVPEDIPDLRKMAEGKPDMPKDPSYVTDGVIEASIGAFGGAAHKLLTWWTCCSPWGNMGLFHAWEATLRCTEMGRDLKSRPTSITVNLLLNRASPWMDIDSYLPYEGRVVLRNKQAKEAFVRMPLWVELDTVKCRVGKRVVQPRWFGRYLQIGDLKPGDTVAIEFLVEERTEQWTSPVHWPFGTGHVPSGVKYTCRFRGNTVVEITPPFVPDSPIYQGRPDKYKAAKAPMKRVTRYVADQRLQW